MSEFGKRFHVPQRAPKDLEEAEQLRGLGMASLRKKGFIFVNFIDPAYTREFMRRGNSHDPIMKDHIGQKYQRGNHDLKKIKVIYAERQGYVNSVRKFKNSRHSRIRNRRLYPCIVKAFPGGYVAAPTMEGEIASEHLGMWIADREKVLL